MSNLPTLAEMLKAGVHFGHQKSRWHPKMKQYIFGVRNGVHVINLEETQKELEKTLEYVRTLAGKGKVILFVGTKKQARGIIQEAAIACGMPFITERWIGGLLTNFEEVRRRLKKFKTLRDQVATGEIEKYIKKEQASFKKQLAKMERYLSGIVSLDKLPDAIYIADLRMEKTAVTEANRMHVPIVAVVDSNVNPEKAQHIIPGNDDAVNSIRMMANLVAGAVSKGKLEYEVLKVTMTKEDKKMPATAAPSVAHSVAEPKAATPRATLPKKTSRPLKVTSSI
ncbi:MAG: 30S ribosomal protein S2 [bacterium]|nr:30S ribosomal protein S2 [bacterium]